MGKYGQNPGRRPVPNPFHDLQFLQCFGALSIGFAFVLAILYLLEKNKKKRLEDQLSLEKKNNKSDHKKSKESIKTYRSSVGSLERELDKVKEINRKLDAQLKENLQELDKKAEENKMLLNDRMDRDFILHEAGLRFQTFPQELLKLVQVESESKNFVGNMANILNKIEIWKKLIAIYLDQEISVSFRVRYFNLIVDMENLEKSREMKNFQFQQLQQNKKDAAFSGNGNGNTVINEYGAGDHHENSHVNFNAEAATPKTFAGDETKSGQMDKILEEIEELEKLQNTKMHQLSFLQAQLENQGGTGNLSLSLNSNSNSNSNFSTNENSFAKYNNNYGDFPTVKNVNVSANPTSDPMNNNKNRGKMVTLPRNISKPVPVPVPAPVAATAKLGKVKRSNSLSLPWQILQKNESKSESLKSGSESKSKSKAAAAVMRRKLNSSVDDRLLFHKLSMSGESRDEFEGDSNISNPICLDEEDPNADLDAEVDVDSSILSHGDGDISTKGGKRRPKIPAFITKLLKKRKNLYAFSPKETTSEKGSDSGSGSAVVLGFGTEGKIPLESHLQPTASAYDYQDKANNKSVFDFDTPLRSLNLQLLTAFETRYHNQNESRDHNLPDVFPLSQPEEKILVAATEMETLNTEKNSDGNNAKNEGENGTKENPLGKDEKDDDIFKHIEMEEICGQAVKNLVYVSLDN